MDSRLKFHSLRILILYITKTKLTICFTGYHFETKQRNVVPWKLQFFRTQSVN